MFHLTVGVWVIEQRAMILSDTVHLVHGPEQLSVPSGRAKLGNVFYVHICPVHYLSHDRPLKLTAFIWLASIFCTS